MYRNYKSLLIYLSILFTAIITNSSNADVCKYVDNYGRITYVADPEHPACKTKQKESLKLEISKLEEKKTNASVDKCERNNFLVKESRYYEDEHNNPTLEFSIENKTSTPISGATIEYTIKSQDRAVPWIEEIGRFDIPGGIEPGEKINKKFQPIQLRMVEIPSSAYVAVRISQIYSPYDKALCSTPMFSDQDERLLEELKKNLISTE